MSRLTFDDGIVGLLNFRHGLFLQRQLAVAFVHECLHPGGVVSLPCFKFRVEAISSGHQREKLVRNEIKTTISVTGLSPFMP